jgi:hypothetical protein
MSNEVQIRGGTYTQTIKFTGLARELWMDTSNWDLILHDGSTMGGHRILSMANSDQRYQAKSSELDGLAGFEPQQKGILVRLGPANYRLRSIVVNEANLQILNPAGQGGNIVIGFADVITSDHDVEGEWGFEQAIDARGGVDGDLRGNVTGNLTGNVTGDVTGDLLGDSEGTHTGPQIGDVDVRGKTLLLDDGQILLDMLGADVIAYIVGLGNRPGFIQMWSGSLINIPSGWFLCDGSNGTPDLRNRFIMGAGAAEPHGVGGVTTHRHAYTTVAEQGTHTHAGDTGGHALTVDELPQHRHGNGVVDKNDNLFNHGGLDAVPTKGDSIDGNSSTGDREGWTTYTGENEVHVHPLNISNSGTHQHSGNTEYTSNLPPYYLLAFIMKGS